MVASAVVMRGAASDPRLLLLCFALAIEFPDDGVKRQCADCGHGVETGLKIGNFRASGPQPARA
jgi:hypothetical protein